MTRDRLRWAAVWRRLLFFSLTFLTSLSASALMADILRTNGFTPWEKASLIVFFVLVTWITGAFWTAVAGFVVQLVGRDRAVIHSSEGEGRALQGRTAVIMPIYNEDTTRVFAGLDVIWSSLQARPEQAAFDLFVLSDTRRPEIGAAEEVAWARLVERHNARGRIFYRRRKETCSVRRATSPTSCARGAALTTTRSCSTPIASCRVMHWLRWPR